MLKQFTVTLSDLEVLVTCRRKKDVITRVYADGRVRVSAPVWFSKAQAQAFVAQNAASIKAQLAKRALSPQEEAYRLALTQLNEHDVVPLWGQDVPIVYKTVQTRADITLTSEALVFSLPKRYQEASFEAKTWRAKQFEQFLRQEIACRIPALRASCEQAVGAPSGRWSVRKMRSRWGSCRTETGNITINLDLATHDPRYLTNVGLHEACHLKVPNHGPAFKALMDRVSPGWRALDSSLEREGVRLG